MKNIFAKFCFPRLSPSNSILFAIDRLTNGHSLIRLRYVCMSDFEYYQVLKLREYIKWNKTNFLKNYSVGYFLSLLSLIFFHFIYLVIVISWSKYKQCRHNNTRIYVWSTIFKSTHILSLTNVYAHLNWIYLCTHMFICMC